MKFHRDPLQSWGNITIQHFLGENGNFKLSYFFQFTVELTKLHIFAKFGMANLIIHWPNFLFISSCFEKELYDCLHASGSGPSKVRTTTVATWHCLSEPGVDPEGGVGVEGIATPIIRSSTYWKSSLDTLFTINTFTFWQFSGIPTPCPHRDSNDTNPTTHPPSYNPRSAPRYPLKYHGLLCGLKCYLGSSDVV